MGSPAAGTAAIGTTVTLAGGGTATVASATTVAVVNAGFTALASQAAVSLASNKGNLGAVFKDLASVDTIRNLATSMLTAGLIEGLGVADALSSSTEGLTGNALKATEFANNIKVGIAKGIISSTVDSAINGTSLSENMKASLLSAGANAVSQLGSQILGDIGLPEGDLRKILGHAFVGGVSAKIAGQDFVMGAAAGAVTQLASPLIDEAFNDGITLEEMAADRANRVQLAGVIAATTVALAGGDVGDIYRAASIAQISRQYNDELHPSTDKIISGLQKRRGDMDAMLAETDPDAVKAVLQSLADGYTRSLSDIDTTGLDPAAVAVVAKYGSLLDVIVKTPEQAAGMLAGIGQSVTENAYDSLLVAADQVNVLIWVASGYTLLEDAAQNAYQRNVARIDGALYVLGVIYGAPVPDNLTAYYQNQKDLAQQYRNEGNDFEAEKVLAKLNTDITTGILSVAATGTTFVTKLSPIAKIGKNGYRVPSNLTSRGTFTNLRSGDAVVLQSTPRTLVQDASGRYWLESQSGNRITPSGFYEFVTMPDGTVRVARPNTNPDYSTHLGLSGGGEVNFAGSIRFGNNQGPKRGTITSWSNDSGHYQPPANLSENAGLPTDLFESLLK
ncbi:MAG: DUF637 domain-containing protein [Methylocystaceae bacterium]|nr:DUF637 domain-containing protein [Methylocystaceae bacterium]